MKSEAAELDLSSISRTWRSSKFAFVNIGRLQATVVLSLVHDCCR